MHGFSRFDIFSFWRLAISYWLLMVGQKRSAPIANSFFYFTLSKHHPKQYSSQETAGFLLNRQWFVA